MPKILNLITKELFLRAIREANETKLKIFLRHYQEAKAEKEIEEDFLNIPLDDNNTTALLAGVFTDDPAIIAILIAAGALPNQQLPEKYAPIHIAAWHKKNKALAYLIKISVDLNLKSLINDMTALMYAASVDNERGIELLHEAKADLNAVTSAGITATFVAVGKNSIKALVALISSGADLDVPHCSGFASVHTAAYNNSHDALRLLIQGGANINAFTSNQKATALSIAVDGKAVESVEVILTSKKANLTYLFGEEQLPLIFLAAKKEQVAIFELFIKHGNPYCTTQLLGVEISLRHFIQYLCIVGKSKALQIIHKKICSIPLFPAYTNGGDFSYTSVTRQNDESPHIRKKRKNSFCIYGRPNEVKTYYKHSSLGEGNYGHAYLMETDSEVPGKNYLVVKVIPPIYTVAPDIDENNFLEHIYDVYPKIAHEAYVNYQVYGVGTLFYEENKAFEFITENGIQKLTSYPNSYIATKFIAGQRLTDFHPSHYPLTGDAFFQIFISLLSRLRYFHQRYVHCDLNSNNIIVKVTPNGKHKANLIDFFFTRPLNGSLNVSLIVYKHPEYIDKTYVNVTPKIDIFSVGMLLKVFFMEDIFSLQIGEKIFDLINNMTNADPSQRPNATTCLKKLVKLYGTHRRQWERIETFKFLENFLQQFKQVSPHLQIQYLRDLGQDITLLKPLINNMEHFLQFYEVIAEDKKGELLEFLGANYLLKKLECTCSFVVPNHKLAINFLYHFSQKLGEEHATRFISIAFDAHFARLVKGVYYGKNQDPLAVFISNAYQNIDQQADKVVKMVLARFIANHGLKSCLQFCDKLKDDKVLYKKLLLSVNQVYRERRDADPRDYFTFFGRYSKYDKIQASELLEYELNGDHINSQIFNEGALNQGNLGTIATRLRSCI